jgi:hypothetical protein
LAAFLAEIAGVEPIIGAFVAGLALNKHIPYSSSLMNRIEFIGNAIFIPIFLISVGMLVDIAVLLNGPVAVIVAVTLSVVALIGKWLAAIATSGIFKYSVNQRNLIFGLSSSHAAATLAIILIGFQTNIIDENALNGTILLILVTCLVATMVTENTARKIIKSESEEPAVEYGTSDAENIMIPIADIESMETLVELAVYLKNKKSKDPLTILSVVPHDEEAENNLIKARNNLQKLVKIASAHEIDVNVMATIDHNIAGGILRASREEMIDMIVIGWPRKVRLFDRLIETKTETITSRTSKAVYICDFKHGLIGHNRIVLACSPSAELEQGFEIWLGKIINLAKELSINVFCYCNTKTAKAIHEYYQLRKQKCNFDFCSSYNISNLQILKQQTNNNDLLFYIGARRSSVSYDNCMENIQEKLEKSFPQTSKIIVYPQVIQIDSKFSEYGDIDPEPLSQGFEKIQKISNSIGSLLKKHQN